MLIRSRISVSLDGFVATPGGWPAVEADARVDHGAHDNDEFAAQCELVVMGRTCFDQGFEGGWEQWPHPGKRVFVLTSRPLPERAAEFGVAACHSPEQLVEQLRGANVTGDVQVIGGGRMIQSLLQIGALDRLELLIMPFLMGRGIPLFDVELTTFSMDDWDKAATVSATEHPTRSLQVVHQNLYPDGVVELVYAPA